MAVEEGQHGSNAKSDNPARFVSLGTRRGRIRPQAFLE